MMMVLNNIIGGLYMINLQQILQDIRTGSLNLVYQNNVSVFYNLQPNYVGDSGGCSNSQ